MLHPYPSPGTKHCDHLIKVPECQAPGTPHCYVVRTFPVFSIVYLKTHHPFGIQFYFERIISYGQWFEREVPLVYLFLPAVGQHRMYLCIDRIQELQTANGCTQLLLALLRTTRSILVVYKVSYSFSKLEHFFPITKIGQMMRDSRFLPRCGSALRSSSMLRSISWQLFIDVSGQYIDSIFKSLIESWKWGDIFSWNVGKITKLCRVSQKGEDPILMMLKKLSLIILRIISTWKTWLRFVS